MTEPEDDIRLAAEALAGLYDDIAVTEVIRPAAVLPENAARTLLVELAHLDVRSGGRWASSPSLWERYDRPWTGAGGLTPGEALLLGSMQVAYGTPTRYAITIYRATITTVAAERGWTVTALCDEALALGGYSLADCPRADLTPPPKPFRMGN